MRLTLIHNAVAGSEQPSPEQLIALGRSSGYRVRYQDAHAEDFAQVLDAGSAYRDVTVALRYCGDDPDGRALVAQHQLDLQEWMKAVSRWNELRKSDPEAAGARPARPAEPRVEIRACRDSDIPR